MAITVVMMMIIVMVGIVVIVRDVVMVIVAEVIIKSQYGVCSVSSQGDNHLAVGT